jgi:hypothetical protein
MRKKNVQTVGIVAVMAVGLVSIAVASFLAPVAQPFSFERQPEVQWTTFSLIMSAIIWIAWHEQRRKKNHWNHLSKDSQRLQDLLATIHRQTMLTIQRYEEMENGGGTENFQSQLKSERRCDEVSTRPFNNVRRQSQIPLA